MADWKELRYALSLREFEPQSWRDYALIPWHVAGWLLACVLTALRSPFLKRSIFITSDVCPRPPRWRSSFHCWRFMKR